MMPEPASHPFVKYVSGVAGHHVERYGTGTVIGGRRQPAPAGTGSLDTKAVSLEELMTQRGAGKLEIDESVIVALTAEEWATHWKAYGRALRKGALTEREAAEYWAMIDVQAKRSGALQKLLLELEKLSPGATARLAERADDVTDAVVREAIAAAKAAAKAAAPVRLPGGATPAAGTLPAEAEPLRLSDEERAEIKAEILAGDVDGRWAELAEGEADG